MGEKGAETGDLINALQEQMTLRKREDEEFEGWQTLIRQSFPEDEAEDIVLRGRARFEGVPVESLTPAPAPAEPVSTPGESADAPPPDQTAQGATADTPATSPDSLEPEAMADGAPSEPIVLPRWGGAGSQPDNSIDAEPGLEGDGSENPEGSFEDILTDADATTPPTSQWPLVEVLEDSAHNDGQSESAPPEESLFVEPTGEASGEVSGEVTSTGASPEDARAPESSQAATPSEPVSVHEALATKPVRKIALDDLTREAPSRFGFDHVGAEPTADNVRSDRATQLLWAWWALGTPLPLVLLGVWLVDSGLSLVQAVIAAAAGALLAAIPLILGTLKGAQSGLPTLVSSRAAFGMVGNVAPAVLMVVVRLFVAVVVVFAAAWVATGVLVESNYWNGEPALMQVITGAFFALVAAGLAIAGRGSITIALWAAAGMGLLVSVGFFLVTFDQLSGEALRRGDGALSAVVAGAALVMSALLVFWAHFGGDIARFQQRSSGAAGPSIAAAGALVPVLGLTAWGALLGASGDENRALLFADFFDTVLGEAPGWYPIPALLLGALPLVAIAALAVHSSGYGLLSLGIRIPRYAAATIAGALVALGVIALIVFAPELSGWLIDATLVAGVLVASWVGVFAGEVLTRRAHIDPRVLAGTSGDFPRLRIAPVLGFVGSIGVGLGLISVDTVWLQGLGYLLGPLQQWGLMDLSGWQLGPFIALALGLTVALLAGIRGGVHVSERR
jgi:purine-cytosine permease-like protein